MAENIQRRWNQFMTRAFKYLSVESCSQTGIYYLTFHIDSICVCFSQLRWLSLDNQFDLCNLLSKNKDDDKLC